ncbi:MAG: hypothetical protein U9N44_05455 [Chloroflexota bacterium]|nr:hypothetical protein [Chloroflexota bacterium]
MSKKKGVFAAIAVIYVVLIILAAWFASSTVSEAEPESNHTPTATPQIADKMEAAECVRTYLDSYAVTSEAQGVLAEMESIWECGPGYMYSEGGWEVSIWFDQPAVDENETLSGIFQDARRYCESEDDTYNLLPGSSCPSDCIDHGVYYMTIWLVSADGLHVLSDNMNADLLLLALLEE